MYTTAYVFVVMGILHREFPLDLFVLLVPPQSLGVVVNYIQEAIFLEILSWGKIAR
jgi:hypothetical protein